MKYPTRANVNRQYYLSREVAAMLGTEAEYIPNDAAIVMFPKGQSPTKILRSLAVIQHDLETQIEGEIEDLEEAHRASQPESIRDRLARLKKIQKTQEGK